MAINFDIFGILIFRPVQHLQIWALIRIQLGSGSATLDITIVFTWSGTTLIPHILHQISDL